MIDHGDVFDMLSVMVKIYENLGSTVETIVPNGTVPEDAVRTFWHPENATMGDAFFDVPSITLTAEDLRLASAPIRTLQVTKK